MQLESFRYLNVPSKATNEYFSEYLRIIIKQDFVLTMHSIFKMFRVKAVEN